VIKVYHFIINSELEFFQMQVDAKMGYAMELF